MIRSSVHKGHNYILSTTVIDSNKLYVYTSIYNKKGDNPEFHYTFDLNTLKILDQNEADYFTDKSYPKPDGTAGHVLHNSSFLGNPFPLGFGKIFNLFTPDTNIDSLNARLIRMETAPGATGYYKIKSWHKDTLIPIINGYFSDVEVKLSKNKQLGSAKISLDDGKQIINLSIVEDKNHNCKLFGRYYEKNNRLHNYGIFYTIINPQLETVTAITYLPLIINAADKKTILKHESAPYIFRDDNLKSYIKTENNHYIELFTRTRKSDYSFQSGTSYATNSAFVDEGFLILNFTEKGEIKTNEVYIDQFEAIIDYKSSFICELVNDKIVLIFYDHKNNAEKPVSTKKIKTCEFNSATVLMSCTYDFTSNTLSPKTIIDPMEQSKEFYLINSRTNILEYYISSAWYFEGTNGKGVFAVKIVY